MTLANRLEGNEQNTRFESFGFKNPAVFYLGYRSQHQKCISERYLALKHVEHKVDINKLFFDEIFFRQESVNGAFIRVVENLTMQK